MTALGVQALLTVLLGAAAFVYVARRDGQSEVRAPLLCVLGALVFWMLGALVIELAASDAAARWGFLITYMGGAALAPSWLFVAARFTRSPLFARRPQLLIAACVPAALATLALLTNDGHRLFGESLDREILRQGPLAWGGPIYWATLVWQIGLCTAGIAIFLGYAHRSMSQAVRRSAQVIAVSGALPVLATLARNFGLLPEGVDPVPVFTGFAVAATIGIVARYRLLDFLPQARRDVIDALDEAVILTDARGLVLDLNPAAHALLGAPSRPPLEEPMARLLARLAPEPELEAAESSIETALLSGRATSVPLRTRADRELSIALGSVADREGRPSARFAVVRDLTDSRRFERMLRESQQRVVVGGIAAALAHEVNNPLAFVASNLQQIQRVASFAEAELEAFEKSRATELSELAEVVGETIEGVERIAEIIGRIIRPASLSESEVVRLDLGALVEDAVRLVTSHGTSAVRPGVAPMPELPEVEGSPERLTQAVLNLIQNAQSAAETIPDASLFVEAVADGGGVAVRLSVRRADGSPCDPPPRIAAGGPGEAELSAAYEAVREHGGTLETGSEGGLLFVLRLPGAA